MSKECLMINATFRFAPDDSNHNGPTNTQLKQFLTLKKSNVVLPRTHTLDSAKSFCNIQSTNLKDPPHKSWKDSLVYELTGIEFGRIVPKSLEINDGTVKLSFSVVLENLKEHFGTTEYKATKEALKDEMDVRSDDISQQVFFNYFTKKKTYAHAIITRARASFARVSI
jgi:hypothetical protein